MRASTLPIKENKVEPITTTHLWRMLIAYAKDLPENTSVLEIGCGTGWFGRRMFEGTRSTFLVGVDVDKNAVTIARRAGSGRKTDYVCADMRCLPFVNVSFDSVIVNMTLHHLDSVEDVRQTFKSATRVIARRGSMVLSEITFDNPLEVLARKLFFGLPYTFQTVMAGGEIEAFHPHPTIPFTANLLLALVKSSGFKIVEQLRFGGLLSPFSSPLNLLPISEGVRAKLISFDERISGRIFAPCLRTLYLVARKA